MLYKKFGMTGKKVSAIGFGGMRFRPEDYKKDPEICADIVRYANSKGINYFDTCVAYCEDHSEDIMGLAFKNMPSQFYCATKSSIRRDPDADAVCRRVENSLRRMNVDKIDFFYMWCVYDLKQYYNVIAKGGPYEGAMRMKEQGLVDHICISTHASGDEIVTMVNDGLFEGILLGYNVINFPFRRKGLIAAHEKGMGIVTMNPLGGGLIPQNPDYFSFLKYGDGTLVQSALRFNISHKEISVALTGISTKEQVDENVAAAEAYSEFTEERMSQISSHIKSELNLLCTGCSYCQGCPKELPVAKYMDAYNQLILSKDTRQLLLRLRDMWALKPEMAKECISCSQCESRCTQHIPIIERLKEISTLHTL